MARVTELILYVYEHPLVVGHVRRVTRSACAFSDGSVDDTGFVSLLKAFVATVAQGGPLRLDLRRPGYAGWGVAAFAFTFGKGFMAERPY